MLAYLAEYGLKPVPVADFAAFVQGDARFALSVAPLANGFALPAEGWAVVTEAELYAGTVRQRDRREAKQSSVEGMLRDLSELKVGDPVVHVQHGIGRYLGLANLDLGEGMTEFLQLQYEGGDKLYVPVTQLGVISRYSGAQPEAAPLHKLGSGQWDKAKARAGQVRDTAAELLALYARRATRMGHAFALKAHDLEAFAESFGFEETADQAAAIEAVVGDMTQGKPMDRLVCGDVGFGKTEVALRAAFVAVADGKQVAILAPTTLLAEQHFQTFGDRFADWPVKIAELSRFRTAKEAGRADGARDRGRQRRHRHRHAQAAVEGREVRAPGPGDHRRGAPLRRAPEGGAEAAARRGRRADAHRHADPAHAGAVARRPARFLGDRHRAAAAPRDQDLRHAVFRGHRARSLPCAS